MNIRYPIYEGVYRILTYKGYSEGTVVGDFGNKIVVRLSSGKEVVEYRDEVIIYD